MNKQDKKQLQEYEALFHLPLMNGWALRARRAFTIQNFLEQTEQDGGPVRTKEMAMVLFMDYLSAPDTDIGQATTWNLSDLEIWIALTAAFAGRMLLVLSDDKELWLECVQSVPNEMMPPDAWVILLESALEAHTFTRAELVPLMTNKEPSIRALGMKLMAKAT